MTIIPFSGEGAVFWTLKNNQILDKKIIKCLKLRNEKVLERYYLLFEYGFNKNLFNEKKTLCL